MSKGKRFSDKANSIFRVMSAEDITTEVLIKFVESFQTEQLPRLKELLSYYLNDTKINKREDRGEDRADNRLSHNFARYITTLIQGYMIGKPVTYNHNNESVLEQLNGFNDLNNEQSHNSLMELNLSIYGRAYEIIYTDKEAQERIAVIDPKECFVIYDTTVEMNPVAAVRVYEIELGDDKTTFVELYTADKVIKYKTEGNIAEIVQEAEEALYFGSVPIIEYWNNDERIGDFEPVLGQIDGYDNSQSDTANDQEDFANAYLVFEGQPNTDGEAIKNMKQSRAIVLDEAPQGERASVYYLTKTYDVDGVEAYKNRLVNDIHKLAFVPDMSDEKFSGNTSGESLKYKLFMLDQLRATKERLFKEGLMTRYRIVANVWGIKQKENGIEELEIIFTPNLPANVKEMVDIINNSPDLSEETKLSNHPLVEDVRAEQERKRKEREAAMKEFQAQPLFDKQEVNDKEEVDINGG